MPHNLYLHSSIDQTRNYERNTEGKKMAVKFATIDSTVSLLLAFFINAAILIVAAATFRTAGNQDVADISDAYKLLTHTVAGYRLSKYSVCNSSSCFRTKLHTDRNISGTNSNGRIFEYQVKTIAKKINNKIDCNNSCIYYSIYLRRERDNKFSDFKSGDFINAVKICCCSARSVYK